MHEVCVGRGWCGSIVNDEPESGPVTAEQLVAWLFQAEGVNPGEEPERWHSHKYALREAFIRHLGGDVVDAQRLKWDVG